jgi:hypothetical protein
MRQDASSLWTDPRQAQAWAHIQGGRDEPLLEIHPTYQGWKKKFIFWDHNETCENFLRVVDIELSCII